MPLASVSDSGVTEARFADRVRYNTCQTCQLSDVRGVFAPQAWFAVSYAVHPMTGPMWAPSIMPSTPPSRETDPRAPLHLNGASLSGTRSANASAWKAWLHEASLSVCRKPHGKPSPARARTPTSRSAVDAARTTTHVEGVGGVVVVVGHMPSKGHGERRRSARV